MPSENFSSQGQAGVVSESSVLRQAQKMEMVGRMASSVIHDLNNFLTVIQLNAALLEDVSNDPEELTRMVGEINRACATAAGLTRNMLSFARRKETKVEAVQMQKLLGEVVGFLQCLLPQKAKIHTDFCDIQLWVKGDRAALTQAIMNLMLNALDSGSAEEVQLTLQAKENEVEVTVTDFGVGIHDEDMPHIFEPFFTTKTGDKGTGLGLPIVRQVIGEHGGRVEVESEYGKGAVFRLFFPMLLETDLANSQVLVETKSASPRKGKAILLVEDDEGIRIVASQILARQGYNIYSAGDADEARILWNQHAEEIALLFTDVVLPGVSSGEDLAQELSQKATNLEVLFTSGNAGALRSSSVKFIPKPFSPEVLTQKVRELIG